MKHKHHIIPRYRGGSDDPSNLVEVSITQHIMFHFANYQLWGNYKDKVAYKLLANTDASEEMEEARLQSSREAIKNLPPEHFVERGKKISAVKKARAHITRELMKKQRAGGIALTEEGKQRVIEGARRANEARSRGVLHTETGVTYPSIREAARQTNTSRNTIKNCIKKGLDKWVEI